MAALTAAHQAGTLVRDPDGQHARRRTRHRALDRHHWVVYAKTPLGGPAQVLEYLSRYTHRTAIGNQRIRAISAQQVTITVRADDHGGKQRVLIEGVEFVRRFLLHVLPRGIKRIRHYGILASASKRVKLTAARLACQMPAVSPRAIESAQAFMVRVAKIDMLVCPCCKAGRLRTIAVLAGQARLPPPCTTRLPPSQGPP